MLLVVNLYGRFGLLQAAYMPECVDNRFQEGVFRARKGQTRFEMAIETMTTEKGL